MRTWRQSRVSAVLIPPLHSLNPIRASALVTALLNLMSLYHDTLLARRLVGDKFKFLIPPSDHSRYTRAWTEKRVSYKHVARTLEIIRYLQLVIEMKLRRRVSERGVWKGVVTLEAIKLAFIVCSNAIMH